MTVIDAEVATPRAFLVELFRDAVRTGLAPDELPPCPRETWGASYAYWRFLKRLRSDPGVSLDHGVLLRQAVRWSGDRLFIGRLADAFRAVAKACGVALTPAGELVADAYRPAWLAGDDWPIGRGLDDPPVIRVPDERIPAEPWLWAMGSGEGIRSWHSLAQKEACWQALTAAPGSTTLVALPTGAGKSLVFQTLARFATGVTVVIVPTVALAIDQWTAAGEVLGRFPQLAPRYYAANDPASDPAAVRQALKDGTCRLLFVSPEACVSGSLRAVLDELAEAGRLENLVVDEAHIIDTWGSHFRVEFQLLAVRRRQWREKANGRLRTFLLSATFTPSCQQMLQDLFGGGLWQQFASQRLRPEMTYARQAFAREDDREARLLEALRHLPRPLILYATEVKEAERLRDLLLADGYRTVAAFTGNVRSGERKRLLDAWRANELDIMVATSAFGMGVDKPDVRAVVHACFPENLHRYYQEVGRGGRDGASSICLWLPTTRDREVAAGLLPTLLGPDLIRLRWSTMLHSARSAGDGRVLSLPMDAKHQRLLGYRSYGENIRWNKRLVLMMARAGLVELVELASEQDPDAPGEYVEWVSLISKFPPQAEDLPDRLAEPRRQELVTGSQGLLALDKYQSGERPICRLLRREYGDDTQVVCGGCPACRGHEADRHSVPPLDFDNLPPTNPKLEVIASTESFATPRAILRFAERIRDLMADAGPRRLMLAPALAIDIRQALAEVLPPDGRGWYRIDDSSDVDRIIVGPNDHLLCVHNTEPDRRLMSLRQGRRVSHLFPTGAKISDPNGRVVLSDAGAAFFTSLDQWLAEL